MVLVLDGLNGIESANRGRTGFEQRGCTGHDQPTAGRDRGEKKSGQLSGVVEADEVYRVAGHKGHPEIVRQRGRGTLETEKPPVFGLSQRGGEVVIHRLENVQQKTIQPIIIRVVANGTTFYTDQYTIYDRLEQSGYDPHTVNHSQAE